MVQFDAGLGDTKKKSRVSVVTLVGVAAVFAVLSVICYFAKIYAGATVFGGLGLLLGGFSFGRAFTTDSSYRKVLVVVVAAALIVSVVGFMLGFTGLLG